MELLAALRQHMNMWQMQPIDDLKTNIVAADVGTLRKHLKELTVAQLIKDSHAIARPTKLENLRKDCTNKQVRFCSDYQQFIQNNYPQQYEHENIEKALNCLIGNQCYSVLRLDSRICQFPTYPGEREKPYSVRPLGFYETERMQPGYLDNLAQYQMLLEHTFSDVNMVEFLVHQDYIIVFGKTNEEHSAHLEKAFKSLQANGFNVLVKQSSFYQKTVTFAGHHVSEQGISIDDDKKSVLSQWPRPRTVAELRCFAQFCMYYQQFISGFWDIAKPLLLLAQYAYSQKAKDPQGPWWTKESIEKLWPKECEEAFCRLKNGLLHQTKVLPRASLLPLDVPSNKKP